MLLGPPHTPALDRITKCVLEIRARRDTCDPKQKIPIHLLEGEMHRLWAERRREIAFREWGFIPKMRMAKSQGVEL